MATPTLESAVYAFEGLLPDLESPPIAARRALDHAGLRLSVEGWRSLALDERERLTLVGVPDRIDVDMVIGLLRRASPGPQRIAPAPDPDPRSPPEALLRALEPNRAIDPNRWARLRAVDRYALAHTYRRAVARSAFSLLGEAVEAVLALAMGAPAEDAGYAPRPGTYDNVRALHETTPTGRAQTYRPAGFYSTVETPPEPREAVPIPPLMPPVRPQHHSSPVFEGPAVRSRSDAPPPRPRSDAPPAEGRGARSSVAPPPLPSTPPPGALSNHLTRAGEVHMVDVARKPKTERRAMARGAVLMRPETLARLTGHDAPKGEVLATARIAAIMAAKRTHELLPLCHTVALTHLEVLLELDLAGSSVHVTAIAEAYDRTGCEMEAMVAVSVACLTLYDMLKGIDREMVIADVRLMEKTGGRSGHFKRAERKPGEP